MNKIQESGHRTESQELLRQNEKIISNRMLVQALNTMNIFVIILNKKREIVFMNSELCNALRIDYKEVLGVRPGELLSCKYSNRSDLGCGFAKECSLCEAKNIVVDVIHNHQQIKKNVSIVSEIQGIDVTSSFEESANKIEVEGEVYY